MDSARARLVGLPVGLDIIQKWFNVSKETDVPNIFCIFFASGLIRLFPSE